MAMRRLSDPAKRRAHLHPVLNVRLGDGVNKITKLTCEAAPQPVLNVRLDDHTTAHAPRPVLNETLSDVMSTVGKRRPYSEWHGK